VSALSAVADKLGMPYQPPPPKLTVVPDPEPVTTSTAPLTMADFVGQQELMIRLNIELTAAVMDEEPPGHMLFSGPPGVGKTTIAEIVAHELGVPLAVTTASAVNYVRAMGSKLAELTENSVLFIDEIHGLHRIVEETLYDAMTKNHISIPGISAAKSDTTEIDIPPFTLVGATTLDGDLTQALTRRFQFIGHMTYYTPDELATVVAKDAQRRGITIEPAAAELLGARGRGTPSDTLKLFRAARKLARVMDAELTEGLVTDMLEIEQIDNLGLTSKDRAVLEALCVEWRGHSVGIGPLATKVGTSERSIRVNVEPYLLRRGLIRLGGRGRSATEEAYEHMAQFIDGLTVPLYLDL
jgi:Holliday junction DNA helicase RuvB